MKVIDLLPVLNVDRDINDRAVVFYMDREFVAAYGGYVISCDCISVNTFLNSEVKLISADPGKNRLKIDIKAWE